jgi:hypothetical protein
MGSCCAKIQPKHKQVAHRALPTHRCAAPPSAQSRRSERGAELALRADQLERPGFG